MARGGQHESILTMTEAESVPDPGKPDEPDAVKSGTLDDSAIGALVLAVLAGLSLGIRGRKH
jgi:hypothetical protein